MPVAPFKSTPLTPEQRIRALKVMFVANQIGWGMMTASFLTYTKWVTEKCRIAETEYNRLLAQTLRVYDYADKSVMPQELIDDIQFRVMAALSDETADPMDTPDGES